ncbi:hypothetical protein RHMOL_Rhmol06G0000600 [Rhododendron molle]|uniref:Uncharacterized protein n=1 Tax=Rhododendron molle TaxID=49168 RepID=A0ACC0N7Y2_RHOML|nr:hypothetical protein RHMOL_Rhmol06G0000600 [Rhododendron molle]
MAVWERINDPNMALQLHEVPLVEGFDVKGSSEMTLEAPPLTQQKKKKKFRCWLQGEEEIFLDTATCAMAFRILRCNGYDVSSDPLTQINGGKHESSFSAGHLKHIVDALELYRASEIIIYAHESALEEQHSWSSHFLKEKLQDCINHSDRFNKYVSQEVTSSNICKWSSPSDRWVAETRLDKLKFARQKTVYCYFSAATTLSSPELSDARISWAKHGVLTTVIDDFFDIGGSLLELDNLIQLLKKWDVNLATDCCSEHVQIIFSALQSTICETGAKAFRFQGRNVTSHVIDIWLELLHSGWREAKWTSDQSLPTLEEYIDNGLVSFALGPIVLPTLYLVGPILSDDVVFSTEYQSLFKTLSTSGRLLNDIHTFQRESKEGKLNAVTLHMIHSSGAVSAEESISDIKRSIVSQRRELLRLVLETKSSMVPRSCKNVFWNMSRVLNVFYMKDDGFSSDDMIHVVKAILHEPLSLSG